MDSILIDEARTPLIISGPSTVSTHAYDKYKPQVAELVRAETMLCNRIVSEAKTLLDGRAEGKSTNDDLDREEQAGRLLYKVKLGMPKNKQLQKMMEEPEIRQLVDEAELEVLKDSTKKEMLDLKEELLFTIDARGLSLRRRDVSLFSEPPSLARCKACMDSSRTKQPRSHRP